MTTRTRLGLLGLLSVLALICLAAFVPPDGQERADLAQFFGNFHPLAVHLPIALLLLVPLLEIAARSPRYASLRLAAGFVLGLAAISALVAPALGWLLAWSGGFEGGFVTQHMWGGISVAAGSLLCWALRGRSGDETTRLPLSYVAMLAITVGVMAWTGYRGGQLAHGENHLTEHLPPSLQAKLGLASPHAADDAAQASTFYGARIQPIFEEHCMVCHSASKRKGGLRLDSYQQLIKGGKDGLVIAPGHSNGSDLIRRINLEPSHKDFMPAEGKPPLSEDARKLLALWIDAGASPTQDVNAIAGAPTMQAPAEVLTLDYGPQQQLIRKLESELFVRLVPRSEKATDGLILRTASFPKRCDDAALAKLAPAAEYIVDAELARTQVTDAGMKALAGFPNLRRIDLSYTAVTSAALKELAKLPKLEVLNLTGTVVDDAGLEALRARKSLKLYTFQTKVSVENRAGS